MPSATRYPRGFWGALIAVLVVQTGFGAILPLLPQFVRQHGFPVADMGLMAALYAAVAFVTQAFGGRVADRLGRKWLIVVGIVIEALGTGAFLLPGTTAWYLACRTAQGLGSGAVVPAANALVADLVPMERRGRAYGLMAASQSAGFAVGPMLGGLAGALGGLNAPFVIGTLLNLLAAVVAATLIPHRQVHDTVAWQGATRVWPTIRGLWPYFWMMFAWMGLSGMYDTAWSLYMQWLHASRLVIGLSFTLFGLPLLLFNVVGGRLADYRRRRPIIILAGTSLQTLTVGFYIVSHSALWSIVVSVVEAGAMSLTGPALSASVMDAVPSKMHGTVQGLFQASGTLGAALLALLSGPLLVIAPIVRLS